MITQLEAVLTLISHSVTTVLNSLISDVTQLNTVEIAKENSRQH